MPDGAKAQLVAPYAMFCCSVILSQRSTLHREGSAAQSRPQAPQLVALEVSAVSQPLSAMSSQLP